MEMLEVLGHGEAASTVLMHVRYGMRDAHDKWREEYRERFNPKHYGEEGAHVEQAAAN
jgi:hypothetical protein